MHSSPPETRDSLILRLPDATDVVAWNELVDIYSPLIRRMASAQGMQLADADDLTQEVFSSIARSVSTWLERPDRGPFRAWLLTISRNAAVNHLTRRGTKPLAKGGGEQEPAFAECPAPQSEVTDYFDLEYRREVFRWSAAQVRRQVAEATWSAFWLTQIDGMSVAEASRQIGVSVGTVYVSRSRVMKRIQETVKRYEVTK